MDSCSKNRPRPAPTERRRRLGALSGGALVVANMIGAGVFTTSGFALADLGSRPLVLIAWLIGGVMAMLGALSYAALGRAIPASGGEYAYLSATLHPAAGLIAGWLSLLAGFAAPIAVAGLTLEAYLGSPFPAPWAATAVILAAGALHGVRLKPGVLVQNLAVAVKLVLILGFIGLGAVWLSETGGTTPGNEAEQVHLGALPVTLMWVSFSYSGWNGAVYVAGEIDDPEHNLSRSLIGGTALVTLLYLALNAVFLYVAEPADLAGRADVAAVAAEALGGPALARAVSGLVALALVTSILAMTMAGARVADCMARDGYLPRQLGGGRDAPGAAVAFQVGVALVCVWSAPLPTLLGLVGFLLVGCSAATVAGLFRLRRQRGANAVPVFGYPWVPGAYVASAVMLTVLMIVREPLIASLGIGLIVGVGIALGRRLGRAGGGF